MAWKLHDLASWTLVFWLMWGKKQAKIIMVNGHPSAQWCKQACEVKISCFFCFCYLKKKIQRSWPPAVAGSRWALMSLQSKSSSWKWFRQFNKQAALSFISCQQTHVHVHIYSHQKRSSHQDHVTPQMETHSLFCHLVYQPQLLLFWNQHGIT